jgi:hypothetical protein
VDRISTSKMNEVLDRIHERAINLFVSMPKPILEKAMEPIE